MKSKLDYAEAATSVKNMDDIYEKYNMTYEEAHDIFSNKLNDEQKRAVKVLCAYECNKMMETMHNTLKDIRKGTVVESKEK